MSYRSIDPSASPERVAEEKVDDDDEEYPGLLFLLLLEEAQQRLGDDLVVAAGCGFAAEGVGARPRGRGRRHGRLLLAPAAARPVGGAVVMAAAATKFPV